MRGLLLEQSERGFVLRFALLAAMLLVVPWAVSLGQPTGMLRYLIPASGALIIAAVYLRWPLESLLGLAMYVAFYDSIALHIHGIKQIDEISVALILPIAFGRTWRAWRAWVWWPRDLLLAVALLMGVISSLVAHVPLGTWLPALALASKAIAFFYVVLWSRFVSREIAAAMRVTVVIGVIVMALGLVEMFVPATFQSLFGLSEYIRFRNEDLVVKSLFAHPGLFGYFTALAALIAYANYLTSKRWRWLAAGLFISLGPFLSARRRAILALGGGLFAAFVESRRWIGDARTWLRSWVPVAAGVAVLLVVFMSGLSAGIGKAIDRYGLDSGITFPGTQPLLPGDTDNPQARVALYTNSVEIGRDYFPLGAGLGRYGSWMSREHYSPLYYKYGLSDLRGLAPARPATATRPARVAAPSATDTFWPAILGEMGIIGLIAYIGFFASLGYMLWREALQRDDPVLHTFRLAAGMIFAQAILESVASSMFYSPPRVYLFYVVVGIVASLAWRRRALATE